MEYVIALLLLAYVVAVLKHPANAVAVTFTMYAFEQLAQSHVAYFAEHSAALNIVSGLLVGLAFVQRALRHEPIGTGLSHATVLLAGIYILHPISALWTPDPDTALASIVSAAPYIVLLTFLTPLTVNGPDDLMRAFRTLWAFGSIVLFLILTTADFGQGSRGVILAQLNDKTDTVGNPLAVASLGGSVAILGCLLQPIRGGFGQLLGGATTVLGLYTCVHTGSRGQFFGAVLVIAVGIAAKIYAGRLRITAAAGAVAIGAVAVAWSLNSAIDRFGARFEFETMSQVYQTDRLGPASIMLEEWGRSGLWTWLWGLGGSSSFHYAGFYPHMVPVEVLTELGVIGFLMYVGFAALSLMRCKWLFSALPDELRDVSIAGASLFFFEVVMTFKQGALLGCDYLMCHGLILCGVAQVWADRQRQLKEKANAVAIPLGVPAAVVRPA